MSNDLTGFFLFCLINSNTERRLTSLFIVNCWHNIEYWCSHVQTVDTGTLLALATLFCKTFFFSQSFF